MLEQQDVLVLDSAKVDYEVASNSLGTKSYASDAIVYGGLSLQYRCHVPSRRRFWASQVLLNGLNRPQQGSRVCILVSPV